MSTFLQIFRALQHFLKKFYLQSVKFFSCFVTSCPFFWGFWQKNILGLCKAVVYHRILLIQTVSGHFNNIASNKNWFKVISYSSYVFFQTISVSSWQLTCLVLTSMATKPIKRYFQRFWVSQATFQKNAADWTVFQSYWRLW